ncbi:hypothetical protein [Paraburkholderia silvatlantica]|uniref:Uncharacterized protein n=1 Tax=Paraburkholderia silvatlantica TaxID=321895 RepID=A0ABR6FI61_9BURK|nr:hypothetical protein [Paraburkholderia silvatlantica]MBB2927086.1 hypothetical protein [Paraburkholderia silvatlantica]
MALVDFEFSWMAYFVALFVLMALSVALTLLWPSAGQRGSTPRAHEADAHDGAHAR